MAKKNTKSRYWVDDNSILPEIVVTPQGNYPVLDEAGNPARTVGAIQDINPNAHIYERVNTQPFMSDYIEGETNTAANQRADALDAQVVPHMGDFVSAATKPLDALMPSRWVGLLDKDYDGLSAVDRFSRLFDENNRGLFINDNPYGLFSKRYAEEHPYWAMAGNTAFDIASTPFILNGANKIYNTGKTAYNTGRNAVRNYNFAKALDVDVANTKNAASSSYQIEHYPGYQLKSLMTGNTLEKQLSKNGTISVNSIKAHVNKGSNVEKTVVDKVLSSEQFAGKKAVDYNEFRKAVQDELITYERVPSEEWANYGIEKLGFTDQRLTDDRAFNRNWDNYYNELARDWPRSTHEQRVEEVNRVMGPRRTVIDLNTFTFESPRIPIGNAKHYGQSTLGHSRTYTVENEPEVLYVMESQSDWAQNKPTELLKTHDIKTLQDWEEEMAFQKANAGQGYKGVDYNQEMRDLEAARAFVDPETSYLAENYERRQLQENLRFAAEHGQTKMRYPTSETAAKIEGYPTRKGYIFDKKAYNKIINDLVESNPESKKLDNKILEEFKQDIRDSLNTWFYEGYTDEDIIACLRLRGLKCSPEVKKYISNARASFREGDVYRPEHETILKKYSDFPKQYRKLYKNAEVRTVTDNKGNTWYEVDVPEGYLNQEWRYGLIPWLLGTGTAAATAYGAAYKVSQQGDNIKSYGGLLDTANKFKDGGSKNDYNTWKKKIKDYKGIIVDGDDTYDYYSFFKDNPQMAWDMLNNNPEAHFTDKYKTPNHPTFSDESIYSRTPYIQGGTWNDYSPTVMGQKWNYALSPSQIASNWDVERTINYLSEAENEGAYVTDSNGRYPIVDGTVLGGTLTPVTITPNNHSQGGPLKSASWNDLSMREKADIIKVGVKHGLNRLDDIKSKYNGFAEGGNIYSGTEPHSQQMNRRYIYDILPQLYAMDGVNVRVSSGLRPNAVVYKNGKPTNRPSRHGMGQAVDIVPGEGATFNDIFRVLNNPNSNVSKWMRANGAGFIDETSATGTTKYWHDHKKDHSHVHHQIGGSPATQYATRFNAQQRPVNKAWERRAEAYWEKAQAMYQELLDAGVNPVAAAGILGNVAVESEFNPNAANSINGGHWGYLQNDKNITPWVRANYGGYDHRSQMNYLIAGLQGRLPKSNMGLDRRFNGFNARMQGVTDPEMAAYLWEREYEKSANEGVPQRKYFARYFYNRMMGNNGMAQQQYNPLMFNMEDPSQYNANAEMPESVDPELYYRELDRKKWEDDSYSSLLSSDANQDNTVVDRVQAAPESQASSFLKWIVPMLSSQSSSNTGNILLNTINMLNYGTKSPDIYSSFNPFNLTV